MASKDERETIVNYCRADDTMSIYSSDVVYMRRIQKNDRFTITERHTVDGETVALSATIPAADFDPLKGLKRRTKPLTDEQKQQRAAAFRRDVL